MAVMDLKEVWPDWHIEKQIGIGSYGSVYKAVCNRYGVIGTAAVKIISIPSDITEVEALKYEGMSEAETKTYFRSVVDSLVGEISVMETLKGASNIVCIEDYKVVEKEDTFGWDIFIRMELLTTLNDYMCDKDVSEEDVLNLGIDLCNALEICQRKNIIHRDIKPENIFVNEFGEYKLGDFGVAKKLEYLNSTLSQKGTFGYMAPEVVKSMKYDTRVDMYSLGLVMYKLMNNNRLPFLNPHKQILNHTERQTAIERRIRGEQLLPPVNASPELSHIILKACEYDVGRRFKTASDMKKELQQLKFGGLNNESFGDFDYRQNGYGGNDFGGNSYGWDNGNYEGGCYENGYNAGNNYGNGNYDRNYDADFENGNDFVYRDFGGENVNNGNPYNGTSYAEYDRRNMENNSGAFSDNIERKSITADNITGHEITAETSEKLPAKISRVKNVLTRKDIVRIIAAMVFFIGIIIGTLVVFINKSDAESAEYVEIGTEDAAVPTEVPPMLQNMISDLSNRADFVFLSANQNSISDEECYSFDADEIFVSDTISDFIYNSNLRNLEDIKNLLAQKRYDPAIENLSKIFATKGFMAKFVSENGFVQYFPELNIDIPGVTDDGTSNVLRVNLGDDMDLSYVNKGSSDVLKYSKGDNSPAWDEFTNNADYYILSVADKNMNSDYSGLGKQYYYFNKNYDFLGSIESTK